jgi:5'-3' exonuclease
MQWGSLNRVLENIDSVKQPKRRASLNEHRELALLGKKLAKLKADVPHSKINPTLLSHDDFLEVLTTPTPMNLIGAMKFCQENELRASSAHLRRISSTPPPLPFLPQ